MKNILRERPRKSWLLWRFDLGLVLLACMVTFVAISFWVGNDKELQLLEKAIGGILVGSLAMWLWVVIWRNH